MTKTLDKHSVRQIIRAMESIDRQAEWLKQHSFRGENAVLDDIRESAREVRETLLTAALADIEVEQIPGSAPPLATAILRAAPALDAFHAGVEEVSAAIVALPEEPAAPDPGRGVGEGVG